MVEFDKIYLVWRKGAGGRRTAVGELIRSTDNRYTFRYLPEAKELKKKEGFLPYTEFQSFDQTYNGQVVEIFAQRLTKRDRPDVASYYSFWEVDPSKADDKFYLLGKTQGLLATDNFEFLADYQLVPGLRFLTEVASLSALKLPKGSLQVGDELRFELEANNPVDSQAVKLFKQDQHVGYVKRYHGNVFSQVGAEKLRVTVKAIEQNGYVKRVFIRVELPVSL